MNGKNDEFDPLNQPKQLELPIRVPAQHPVRRNATKQSFVVFMYDDIKTLALINRFDEAIRNYHNGLNNGVEIKEL